MFQSAIEKVPDDADAVQYLSKRDPEGRNVIVLCLLCASVDVLKAIYELFSP